MAYLHELSGWPLFRWDSDRIAPVLSRLRYSQGLFARRCLSMDERARNQAAGLVLARDSEKGLGPLLAEIRQNPQGLLTAARLFGWHKSLGGSGAWRVENAGKAAPEARRIADEMKIFLAWFNFDALPAGDGAGLSALWQDPLVKAGITRLWFTAIRPFSQGSELLAGAACELALMRADAGKAWYGLGDYDGQCRAALKAALDGGLDVSNWLECFLLALEQAVDSAEKLIAPALRRNLAIGRMQASPLNERQKRVLALLLDDAKKKISSGAYAEAAACSSDTALRDIQELMSLGLLRKNRAGGRSTTYSLKA